MMPMRRRLARDFIGGAKVGEHLVAGHGTGAYGVRRGMGRVMLRVVAITVAFAVGEPPRLSVIHSSPLTP